MPQTFGVVRCAGTCEAFQVVQITKTSKWACHLCGTKQSRTRVYAEGAAKDMRPIVQRLNAARGEVAFAAQTSTTVYDDSHSAWHTSTCADGARAAPQVGRNVRGPSLDGGNTDWRDGAAFPRAGYNQWQGDPGGWYDDDDRGSWRDGHCEHRGASSWPHPQMQDLHQRQLASGAPALGLGTHQRSFADATTGCKRGRTDAYASCDSAAGDTPHPLGDRGEPPAARPRGRWEEVEEEVWQG